MEDAFVTIATYGHAFEAEIVRGRLEAEGIEAYIPPGGWAAAYFGESRGGVGTIAVQVRESDSARAMAILEENLGEVMEGEFEPRCPACGSADVEVREPPSGFLDFVRSLASGGLEAKGDWVYACQTCGRKWME